MAPNRNDNENSAIGDGVKPVSVAIMIVVNVSIAIGQVGFAPFTTQPVVMRPRTIQIADLNDDGLNDYVIGSRLYLSTFLQQPDASFSESQMFLVGTVSNLAVGDLNGDQLSDVVLTYDWSAQDLWGDSIKIFFQEDGNLVDGGSLPLGFRGSVPAIGDLNNDGMNDIVVSRKPDYNVPDSMRVFYQGVAGQFDSTQCFAAQRTLGVERVIEIGDFNGDGLKDVIASDAPDYMGVSLYLQQEYGGLEYSSTYQTPWGLGDVAAGDLNNDGKDDIVSALPGNMPDATLYFFFQNSTDDILASPLIDPAYHIPESIDIADVDGDSKSDLIVAHGGWSTVSVYRQTTPGSFEVLELEYPYATHIYVRAMDVGDVNNDSRSDIVLIDWDWGIITLLNETPIVSVRSGTAQPTTFELLPNYPNPFNPSTWIVYTLPEQSHIELFVYNILGQKVQTLVDRIMPAGTHKVQWDTHGQAAGIYVARLSRRGNLDANGDLVRTQKMVLVR